MTVMTTGDFRTQPFTSRPNVAIACFDPSQASTVKSRLQNGGLLDRRFSVIKSPSAITFPVLSAPDQLPGGCHILRGGDIPAFKASPASTASSSSPRSLATGELSRLLAGYTIPPLPDKWEHYSTALLLFPEHAFTQPAWLELFRVLDTVVISRIFECIARSWQVERVARKTRIPVDDILRRPHLNWLHITDSGLDYSFLLSSNSAVTSLQPSISLDSSRDKGDEWWCRAVQNGVTYLWSPAHSMFSPGNITEKTRIARWLLPSHRPPMKQSGAKEVVLDLYAGIGYFTLAYLKSGRVSRVIACEWNEWSVDGLKRACDANGWTHTSDPSNRQAQVLICLGNNEQFVDIYDSKVDRVNLGLIPTSMQGWPLAVRALKLSGGWLHIHENVVEGNLEEHKLVILKRLSELFLSIRHIRYSVNIRHCERVKSFKPRVWHYVFDVYCLPLEVM